MTKELIYLFCIREGFAYQFDYTKMKTQTYSLSSEKLIWLVDDFILPAKKFMNFVEIYLKNNTNTVWDSNNSFCSTRKPKIRTKNLEVFLFHVMHRFHDKTQNPCSYSLILFALFWNALFSRSDLTETINLV